MVQVKRISTKRGTRYVKVKPNGQYQFIKKAVYDRMKGGSSSSPKRSPKRRSSSTRRRSATRTKKTGGSRRMGFKLGNMGLTGIAEDFALGYIGGTVLQSRGFGTAQSLALTRVAQGAVGQVLNRRGKARLVPGIIDYIDAVMLEGGRIPILDELMQLTKVR